MLYDSESLYLVYTRYIPIYMYQVYIYLVSARHMTYIVIYLAYNRYIT
jgi:hypothetical protein